MQIKKLLKYLFLIVLGFYCLLFIFLLLNIWAFVLLELYAGLSLILPMSIMYYCVIDVFVPNRRHSSIYGVFYSEFLEHLLMPMVFLIMILTIPALAFLSLLLMIFYFYGYVLGEIKSFRDSISLIVLLLLIVVLINFPGIIFNVTTGMGWLIIIVSTLLSSISYFTYFIFVSYKKMENSFSKFLKSYTILCLSIIASVIVLRLM